MPKTIVSGTMRTFYQPSFVELREDGSFCLEESSDLDLSLREYGAAP